MGDYDLAGLSAKDLPYFRRRVGIVFQDFKLLKDRSVLENVSLPLLVRGERSTQIQKRSFEALEAVGLVARAKAYPEALSGGEQQRVAIARALIHRPGLLIADEPTGNLDPSLSEDIMDLMERLCAQGTTVFIATHDHAMVERRRKRRIEIEGGEVIKDAS